MGGRGILALPVPPDGLACAAYGFEKAKAENAWVLCLFLVTLPVVTVLTEQTKETAAALRRGDVAGVKAQMAEALLAAGAEVNYAEGAEPPPWWAWM